MHLILTICLSELLSQHNIPRWMSRYCRHVGGAVEDLGANFKKAATPAVNPKSQ